MWGGIHCRTEHRASGVESKRSGGISVSTGGRRNHDTAKAKGFLHTDKMCQVLPGLVQYATYTAMHSKLEAQWVARCFSKKVRCCGVLKSPIKSFIFI